MTSGKVSISVRLILAAWGALQAYTTQQDWEPDTTPSLWRKV